MFDEVYRGKVGPQFTGALQLYVDGTNGDNANNGFDWTHAFATIQTAITYQVTNSSGLGDIIWIAPGDYREELVGDLTKVALVGVRGQYPWHIVMVGPSNSYAFNGTLFEALIKNIAFMSPVVSNWDYPIMLLDNARFSIIEDCHFVGHSTIGEGGPSEAGIQIGPTVDDLTECHLDYCIIRRNRFDSWAGHNSECGIGIKIGAVGGAGGAFKQIVGTTIEDNDIWAVDYGMYFLVGTPNSDYCIVRRNTIDSMIRRQGCAVAGIEFTGGDFPIIADNRINAADAIITPGGWEERVFNNFVTNAGVGPVRELPA